MWRVKASPPVRLPQARSMACGSHNGREAALAGISIHMPPGIEVLQPGMLNQSCRKQGQSYLRTSETSRPWTSTRSGPKMRVS